METCETFGAAISTPNGSGRQLKSFTARSVRARGSAHERFRYLAGAIAVYGRRRHSVPPAYPLAKAQGKAIVEVADYAQLIIAAGVSTLR
jgi:hypothetical protein